MQMQIPCEILAEMLDNFCEMFYNKKYLSACDENHTDRYDRYFKEAWQ